jgi:hypothetical protein
MTDNYRLCFIISHKYYRNYTSYIDYYVNNIQTFYENALTIIVDNNSKHFQDIQEKLADKQNVVFLVNNSQCKFELGAYKVGIQYLMENQLLESFDFCVFTQDTFILKQKYNFNILINRGTLACTIHSWLYGKDDSLYQHEMSQRVLKSIYLENSIHQLSLCWCCAFVLHTSTIGNFIDIVKDIVIENRNQSEASERFLSGILFFLNNHKIEDIDGCIREGVFTYNCYHTDLLKEEKKYYFLKLCQSKTENTLDI